MTSPTAAIVDYGMGNLYSVQLACASVGLEAEITSDPAKVAAARGVILPGVGAFGTAMDVLNRSGLGEALLGAVRSGKPVFGICLGLQLLMGESFEFGRHRGLGVIDGSVVRFESPLGRFGVLKVPQVGWEQVQPASPDAWDRSLLSGVPTGTFMYFVHSYHVVVADPALVVATSQYGHIKYCSALRRGNVFACQFHPERSGPTGLRVYRNFADALLRDDASASSQSEGPEWLTPIN